LFKVWRVAKVILKIIPNFNQFDPIFINASPIFLVFLKSTQLGTNPQIEDKLMTGSND
jgi:hypothetical protein